MRLLISLVLLVCFTFALSPFSSSQSQVSTDSQRQRFSHRRHLALAAISCDNCHYSATVSRQVSDNNLPKAETCLSCHDGIHATKSENAETAYVFRHGPKTLHFDHQQHLALGNVAPVLMASIDSGMYLGNAAYVRTFLETENACEACHRGLRESDATGPAHYPAMADCLACHTRIDPPFSCELCHTKDAKLRPASHTPNYIDLHSSKNAKLDKLSCKICHGTGFRCMGCH
jgi:Cytochrome c7 and related cytochrome c